MTCIIGYSDNGKIFMGADSAGVSGYDLRIRKDSKVFKNRGFLIGFTSSFRMGQLLRYSFIPPERKENKDVFEYMTTDFINEVRLCLKQGGYATINNNEDAGGMFLVGYMHRLFRIESDFQVCEVQECYDAVGCGASYALGSMFSTKNLNPEEKIVQALQAAEAFNAGVRSPFNILSL